RLGAVLRYVRPAVVPLDHAVGILRVDPQRMMVHVHTPIDRRGGLTAVVRAQQQVRGKKDLPVVHRRDVHQREVEWPGREGMIVGYLGPVIALVFRIPQHPLLGFDQRVYMAWVSGPDRERDAAQQPRRQAVLEPSPGEAA